MSRALALFVASLLGWASPTVATEQMNSGTTTTSKNERSAIYMGAQPLAYPVAMVTELMRRDLLLQGYFAKNNKRLDQRVFFSGDEMLDHLKTDELQVAVLGDMPTITAATRGDILIAGLLKQEFSSIVARKFMQIKELKGKRIAYARGTTAHYTLLEGLGSAGLGEKDVTLVEMKVTEMPEALQNGLVDAFAAWEPAPTIALSMRSGNAAIYRGFNSSYLVINKRFFGKNPEDARQILASCIRAINWLRQSGLKNAEKTAIWSLESGASFAGKVSQLKVDQVVKITQQSLLDMSSLPLIPRTQSTGYSPLAREFEFLKKVGKIPSDALWKTVNHSIARELLNEVISQPVPYRLHEFDYAV